MLDSTNSDPEFMNTIITGDESWVYGYDPEPVIFLTMKKPTRALNTTSLKCSLPSADTTGRWELIHACVFKVASWKRSSLKFTRFSQRKK